jgi:hypothetical protein
MTNRVEYPLQNLGKGFAVRKIQIGRLGVPQKKAVTEFGLKLAYCNLREGWLIF